MSNYVTITDATSAQMIEDGWAWYVERGVPPGASEAERTKCRRAFFAGATALFTLLVGPEPCEGSTDDVLEKLALIALELNDFTRDLLAGRA